MRSLNPAAAPRPLRAMAAAPIARTATPTPANTSHPGRFRAASASAVSPTTGVSSWEQFGQTVASLGISARQFGQFNVTSELSILHHRQGSRLLWSRLPLSGHAGDGVGLVFFERLLLEESRCQGVELVAVLGEQLDCLVVCLVEDTTNLAVDQSHRVLRHL